MPDLLLNQAAVARQLVESLWTMEWAASLIPPRWTHQMPDWAPPGAWTVAMNLAHLVTYERCIGLPLLEDLAQGGDGSRAIDSPFEESFLADSQNLSRDSLPQLVHGFRELRNREIFIVEQYEELRFNVPITRAFNSGVEGARPQSAAFVATKSFQHTWEHGNTILRVLLFAPAY